MRSSAAMPRRKKPQASAVVVLRKYRRLRRRRRRSLRHEYHKLRSLLPGAPRSPQLRRKVGVVDAAYHYICQLQSALLAKFSARGVPADLAGGFCILLFKDIFAVIFSEHGEFLYLSIRAASSMFRES
uniref:BHLH domain-containing protein n=1 Tax=Scylla olivacea TaxID=85551 RepID=A0A0P4VWI5_SCYOL